jgi:methylated-DNA-[protein]-cysteine S-methyltransferase
MTRILEAEKSPTICFVFPSPLGWACMTWDRMRLKSLCFGHLSKDPIAPPEGGIITTKRSLPPIQREAVNRVLKLLDGGRVDFRDLPRVSTTKTGFGQRVVKLCQQIPWGKTMTYAEVAERAGSPGGARAVGNVMRANPLPLIIPCHRVVGAAGSLGGYSAPGGVTTKEWLLALERGDTKRVQEIEVDEDWLRARVPPAPQAQAVRAH